jgi:hypothetical protein
VLNKIWLMLDSGVLYFNIRHKDLKLLNVIIGLGKIEPVRNPF